MFLFLSYMVKVIEMWIDKKERLFFESYFDKDDAEKLKNFIEDELGYKTTLEKEDSREFKPHPAIWKKNVVRDIDWSNYKNIIYIIKNRDNSDEDIVKGLGSEGSGFSITIKRGTVMTEYSKLLELGGNIPSEEELIEFAKKICNKFMKGKKINVGIEVLVKDKGKTQKGKIISYSKGNYTIKTEDEFVGIYKRKEFELG